MKKLTTALCAAFVLALILGSCKKYEEGPALSFRSRYNRVVNDWDVKYAFRNNDDFTALYTDWTVNFTEDTRFVISDLDDRDSTVTQEGFWSLESDDEILRLIFTDPPVNPDRVEYEILRLKEDELWFREVTDSVTWEWRLIPNGTASEE